MRIFLILLFLNVTLSLSGATYYVATGGSDNNPGTITQPWLTMQKGFSTISPGDILYIRGGTYYASGTSAGGFVSGVVVSGKKGTSASMYKVFAYPGELPILDCRNITSISSPRIGILLIDSDYWHIKGIEITRVNQPSGRSAEGMLILSGNNNKLENISSHHNGGAGFQLRDACEGNLFLNCDSYSNFDPYSSTPGDDADGFDIGFITARSGNDRINTLIGCRAWSNSDDGYDMYQVPGNHGIYILKECWAWKNGYSSDGVSQAGDGNGFKYGADNNYALDGTIRRSTYNCIAYANRQRGYSQEAANVKMLFYNNIAYQNGSWGFSFYDYDIADVLRNNLTYKNNNGTIENQGFNRIHDHNTWDSKVTVTDADFISLDATQLANPRQSDGSLPNMTFLHLATGSDLINAGVNVGLTYYDTAPEIGAFEISGATIDPTPLFLFAYVENAIPARIFMTYDLDLNNLVVPSLSSFSVLVNSQIRTINSISISGKTVSLNLSSAIKYGDFVVVSYTKPATSPLQTASGKTAATLTAQTVTNNVIASVPVYVSSVIEKATPSVLEMTYSLTLSGITPSASSFSVLVNSSPRSVSSVTVSGTKVTLVLSSPVVYGNTVTISYTKPVTNPLQTSSGAQAISISGKTVTNNTVNAANPGPVVTITSPVNNNSYLSPATIPIMASATDANGSVTLVEFYNGSTKIGSKSSAPYSFTWSNVAQGTYTITAVATDNLGAKNTSSPVTVRVSDVPGENQPPTVSISSPAKGNKFDAPADIEIEIIASDPDGSLTSVELFNGSVKLIELYNAPYTYTWKGVIAGTYEITAIATDNSNAATTSSVVKISVGNKPVYDGNSEIINLYPNPNNGLFTVDFIVPPKSAKSEIIISDLSGNQVYRETITAEETTRDFQIPNPKSGIYIMTVIDQEIIVTKKIIVR